MGGTATLPVLVAVATTSILDRINRIMVNMTVKSMRAYDHAALEEVIGIVIFDCRGNGWGWRDENKRRKAGSR